MSDWNRAWEIVRAWIDQPAPDLTAWMREQCGDDDDLANCVLELIEGARRAEQEPSLSGTDVGPYRLEKPLGHGGMGQVWAAVHRELGNRVAVKLLAIPFADATDRMRFEQEARTQAQLEHPGIARILHSGTWTAETGREYPWFAMELVADGIPISKHGARHTLSVREALDLFARVCEAVGYAHEHGVIHRDLKPSNVLVDGSGRPVVIDFGIATSRSATELTRPGSFVGSLRYSAPERLSQGARGDTRSDVYSLGVILYELLTGVPLLDFDDDPVALDRLLRQQAGPIPRIGRRDAPTEVDWVIAKALSEDREDRYANATELAQDLRSILAFEPVQARPAGALHHARLFWRRNRPLVAGTGAIFLALVAGLWSTSAALDREAAAREQAELARKEAEESEAAALEASREAKRARDQAQTEASSTRQAQQFFMDAMKRGLPKGQTLGLLIDSLHEQSLVLEETDTTRVGQIGIEEFVARLLFETRQFEKAASLTGRSLKKAKSFLEPGTDQLVRIWSLHCQALIAKGAFEEGDRAAEELIQHTEQASPTSLDTAEAYHEIALVNQRLQRFGVAREYYELCRSVAGTEDWRREYLYLSAGANLAMCLAIQGRGEEALPIAKRVYDRRWETDPSTWAAFRNLHQYAEILFETGHFDILEDILERHANEPGMWPSTGNELDLDLRQTWGKMCLVQGRTERAVELLTEVLEGRRAMLGEWHGDVLSAMEKLARAQRDAGNYEKALALARDCFDRRLTTLGPKHMNTLATQALVGSLRARLGKPEGANDLETAWRGLAERLGPRNWRTVATRGMHAEALLALGRLDESIEAYRDIFGPGDLTTNTQGQASWTVDLATALRRAGKLDESRARYRDALDLLESEGLRGPIHSRASAGLALAELEAGSAQDVLPRLTEAWEVLRESSAVFPHEVLEIGKQLVSLLKLSDRNGDAARVAGQTLGALPPSHPARPYFEVEAARGS